MSNIVQGIAKDLKAIPENLKAKLKGADTKKLMLLNIPYILVGYFCDKVAWLWRVSPGNNASDKMMAVMNSFDTLFSNPLPSFHPRDLMIGTGCGIALRLVVYYKAKNAKKFRQGVEYGSARWGNAKDIEPYMDYKTKNPYYKDPADDSDENPAEQLPVSAEATKPGNATGTVTEHTVTDSNGNTTSQTSLADQKKQAMAEADAAEKGEDTKAESGQGKEFYTIQTASDKVFYLIIDRNGEEEMVYFLTEVTENDLLNTTSDNSETLPKNSAALESAIPTEESALPNNNSGAETEQNEETEDTGEMENTESTETAEPEQEAAEEPNPMVSYVLMGVLAVAFIGGAYYFKVVRKKKEDFIEDEDEEEDEEYENEEEAEEVSEDDFFDEKEDE